MKEIREALLKLNEDTNYDDAEDTHKWRIYGQYGMSSNSLSEIKKYAKELSAQPGIELEDSEYEDGVQIINQKDGCYYFTYKDGKLIRDGWTIQPRENKITFYVNLITDYENENNKTLSIKDIKFNAKNNWKLTIKETNEIIKRLNKK